MHWEQESLRFYDRGMIWYLRAMFVAKRKLDQLKKNTYCIFYQHTLQELHSWEQESLRFYDRGIIWYSFNGFSKPLKEDLGWDITILLLNLWTEVCSWASNTTEYIWYWNVKCPIYYDKSIKVSSDQPKEIQHVKFSSKHSLSSFTLKLKYDREKVPGKF